MTYRGNDILTLLLYVALAPTPEERQKLMRNVEQSTGMSRLAIQIRLARLHITNARIIHGCPLAIEAQERKYKALVAMSQARSQLAVRLGAKVEEMRARANRSVSFREAAKILCIPRSVLYAWTDGLWLIKVDENGKIPMPELRRFMSEEGRWLLRMTRCMREMRKR